MLFLGSEVRATKSDSAWDKKPNSSVQSSSCVYGHENQNIGFLISKIQDNPVKSFELSTYPQPNTKVEAWHGIGERAVWISGNVNQAALLYKSYFIRITGSNLTKDIANSIAKQAISRIDSGTM